jgi:hypothetical protein
MSRSLPSHPNLEHLKKQAKDLLNALKQQNPSARLADAQYALAREYGFASWPKLKVYVESLPHPATPREVPLTEVPEKVNPFVGKWTANLEKSRHHPSNQFQNATLEFAVDGDTVTIADVVVDDSGHEETHKNTILVDGNEHAAENESGYSMVARWRDQHIIETIAKKDGLTVGWGTYEVSEDGKTLTITGDEQLIVLDRV